MSEAVCAFATSVSALCLAVFSQISQNFHGFFGSLLKTQPEGDYMQRGTSANFDYVNLRL